VPAGWCTSGPSVESRHSSTALAGVHAAHWWGGTTAGNAEGARDTTAIALPGQAPRAAIVMSEPADRRADAAPAREADSVGRWSLLVSGSIGSLLGQKSGEPPGRTWPWAARRAAGFGIVLGLTLTVVWAVTGAHYFWPGWIWFALALPVVCFRSTHWALRTRGRRSFALHGAISLVIAATLVAIWLMSGHHYFWPIWPILALGVVLAGHALFVPSVPKSRELALSERVDVLTRTRKDTLDVQVAEMRRVERDLHDGAQARLVSLGMSLGMADELLDSDPDEARRLLGEARTAAGDALGDLRALVRGILPPVLADRGLAGAVQALGLASHIPVEVTDELPPERLPAPVESAAYFAVAETLTNVIKHSGARSAWVRLRQADDLLTMVVEDDGRGGADPDQGSGLRGIEHRLEAFDGTVQISSPSGGPTVVTMEVPCALSSPKT
jgi:signal transduction histidine kinase